jgi:small subunit ribosomal protein S21
VPPENLAARREGPPRVCGSGDGVHLLFAPDAVFCTPPRLNPPLLSPYLEELRPIFLNTRSLRATIQKNALAIGIKVRDNENIDRALRRFKRTVNRSRVLRDYRDNMEYTKPSDHNRIEKEKARRNARRASRK